MVLGLFKLSHADLSSDQLTYQCPASFYQCQWKGVIRGVLCVSFLSLNCFIHLVLLWVWGVLSLFVLCFLESLSLQLNSPQLTLLRFRLADGLHLFFIPFFLFLLHFVCLFFEKMLDPWKSPSVKSSSSNSTSCLSKLVQSHQTQWNLP